MDKNIAELSLDRKVERMTDNSDSRNYGRKRPVI